MNTINLERELSQKMCLAGEHFWVETYYGTKCSECGIFYPDGCAPWDDEEIDSWIESNDDPSVYRTCQTCGGEFWDGGTSCTC